jgi:hypothetical protein
MYNPLFSSLLALIEQIECLMEISIVEEWEEKEEEYTEYDFGLIISQKTNRIKITIYIHIHIFVSVVYIMKYSECYLKYFL